MTIDLAQVDNLRRSIESAWAEEEIPTCDEGFKSVIQEDEVAKEFFCGRHWKDADVNDARFRFVSISSFTNCGLRYYLAAYLMRCLAVEDDLALTPLFFRDTDVLAIFDVFFSSTDALERIRGATRDQVACILATAIFIWRQNQSFYQPGALDFEIAERDKAIARWEAAWAHWPESKREHQ
jgi:hypothetical protein